MAKQCKGCGTAASDRATFCNKCGDRLPQGLSAAIPDEGRSTPANPYRSETDTAARGRTTGAEPASKERGSGGLGSGSRETSSRRSAPEEAKPRMLSRSGGFDLLDGASGGDAADVPARARRLVRNFALASAGVWLIPLPGYPVLVLIPVLTAMVAALGNMYQVSTSPRKLLMYFAASAGATVFGQGTLVLLLAFIPFGHLLAFVVGAPFVYGWTYGLGEVAILYFQSKGTATRDEMREVFENTSKKASSEYKDGQKVSKREALDSLRDHLSPQDYDRLSNAARRGLLPDLDLDFSQPERVLESKIAKALSKAGFTVMLSVSVPSSSGDLHIPILCETDKQRWAVYVETELWTPLATDRLREWLECLRESRYRDVAVQVFSPDPVPESLEDLLAP